MSLCLYVWCCIFSTEYDVLEKKIDPATQAWQITVTTFSSVFCVDCWHFAGGYHARPKYHSHITLYYCVELNTFYVCLKHIGPCVVHTNTHTHTDTHTHLAYTALEHTHTHTHIHTFYTAREHTRTRARTHTHTHVYTARDEHTHTSHTHTHTFSLQPHLSDTSAPCTFKT